MIVKHKVMLNAWERKVLRKLYEPGTQQGVATPQELRE
jgi:hypothetical protein